MTTHLLSCVSLLTSFALNILPARSKCCAVIQEKCQVVQVAT